MKPVIALAIAALLAACQGEQPASREADVALAPYSGSVADTASSIRDVAASRVPVGHTVRLSGRCVVTRGVKMIERPPDTGPLWQLEDSGAAVVVSGPRPPSCGAVGQDRGVTITAIVAEDTLPAIGDLPAAPRRYLKLVGGGDK